jgi:hypothetical protein
MHFHFTIFVELHLHMTLILVILIFGFAGTDRMSYLHFAVVEFSLHFGRYVFLVALVGVLHPSGHWVVRLEDMFRVQGAPTITLYRGLTSPQTFLYRDKLK